MQPAWSWEKIEAIHRSELAAKGAADATLSKYASIEGQFSAWVSETCGRPASVVDLDAALLRRWSAHLIESGRSRDTASQYLACLRGLASVLSTPDADDGAALLPRNPLKGLKVPGRESPPVQVFTDAEVDALLRACLATRRPIRNRAMLLFLLDTGLRVSEACGLRLADVQLATPHRPQGHVVVRRGKGGKARELPIPFGAKASRALSRYLGYSDDPGRADWLWLDQYGARWSEASVRRLFRELGRTAQIKDGTCHPHRCRSTWATNAARDGMSPFLIQAILGHSTLDMTRRYTKVAELLEAGYHSHLDAMPRVR